MADYAPPTGPPPPKVPAGWKAVWNDQYHEWFYVNTYTKKSQWDKPQEPVYGAPDEGAPPGPPPGYDHGSSKPIVEKGGLGGLGTNNPYSAGSGPGGASSHNVEDDEAMARRLQAEEEARAQGRPTSRGAANDYYGGAQQPQGSYAQQQSPYGSQQELPARDAGGKSKGFLGKLLGKSSSSRPQQAYPQQQQGYYQQPQGYGGYPPQGGFYGGGYPQQYQQQPQRRTGGMGGGLGTGLMAGGAGLLGGALLMDAIDDHDQNEYQQGYDQGQQGDDGGGDMGGGDMGGDMGGGDMGGGDF